MLPKAFNRWCNHCAHMELIKQQVWVPRQTLGAGHGGAHQASVTCAPAAIALWLWLCSHKPQRERERERHGNNPSRDHSETQVCKQYESDHTNSRCSRYVCAMTRFKTSLWTRQWQLATSSPARPHLWPLIKLLSSTHARACVCAYVTQWGFHTSALAYDKDSGSMQTAVTRNSALCYF